MRNNTTTKMDTFTRAYVECALWSSMDNSNEQGGEPLDANYAVENIAPDTLAQMISDCEQFQADNREDLEESGLSLERQGHDFWLNRNGHGTGFWDEGHNPVFRKLSEACRPWGSVDLYVGDDGKIYS